MFYYYFNLTQLYLSNVDSYSRKTFRNPDWSALDRNSWTLADIVRSWLASREARASNLTSASSGEVCTVIRASNRSYKYWKFCKCRSYNIVWLLKMINACNLSLHQIIYLRVTNTYKSNGHVRLKYPPPCRTSRVCSKVAEYFQTSQRGKLVVQVRAEKPIASIQVHLHPMYFQSGLNCEVWQDQVRVQILAANRGELHGLLRLWFKCI